VVSALELKLGDPGSYTSSATQTNLKHPGQAVNSQVSWLTKSLILSKNNELIPALLGGKRPLSGYRGGKWPYKLPGMGAIGLTCHRSCSQCTAPLVLTCKPAKLCSTGQLAAS
jgi:hypothetical protein